MGLIRFMLALAVIIAHSSPIFGLHLVDGEVAVKTFFIISGFYMALVLTEKYVGKNASFYLFISNRLLKLYPIYWCVLGMAVSFSLFSFYKSGTAGSEKINGLITALSNGSMSIPTFLWYCVASIFLVFQDWFIFLGLNVDGSISFVKNFHDSPNAMMRFLFLPQAWTIGLEITFYLMAPFLVKRNNLVLLGILMASVLIRATLYYFGMYEDPWSYRFYPSELMYFLVGIFVYRFYAIIKNKETKIINQAKLVALPLVLILTITYQWLNQSFAYIAYPFIVAFLIPFIFLKFKNNTYDLKIGELSYPIYMSHITLLIVVQKMHIPILQSIGTTTAIITILFSYVLNEIITKKIDKYRQLRVKRVTLAKY